MLRLLVRFACLGILCCPWFCDAATAQDSEEKEVRQVVEEKLNAFLKKDIDGLMKVVDAPWFHDRMRVIENRDELKALWQKRFGETDRIEPMKMKFIIRKVAPAKKAGQVFAKKEHQAMAEKVLTGGGWFVWVEIRIEGRGEPEGGVWMVDRRGGKLKVVGFSD